MRTKVVVVASSLALVAVAGPALASRATSHLGGSVSSQWEEQPGAPRSIDLAALMFGSNALTLDQAKAALTAGRNMTVTPTRSAASVGSMPVGHKGAPVQTSLPDPVADFLAAYPGTTRPEAVRFFGGDPAAERGMVLLDRTVVKPWATAYSAPLGVPFESYCLTARRECHTIYLDGTSTTVTPR